MDQIAQGGQPRRERLERWAAEQREQYAGRGSRRRPLRARVTELIEAHVAELDHYTEGIFDRRLGTSGMYRAPEVDTVDGVQYVPSRWHVLPRALRAVGASDADVFVDFGCGKGRIVHQAARWPLKRVIGVEVSPELAALATRLVDAHRGEYRCRNVDILVCDAARFQVPPDLTIAYLFDPFYGKTLDAVLRNLIESIDKHPRRMRLIYVHPRCGAQVLGTNRFQLAKWQRGGLRDYQMHRAAIFESCDQRR